MTQDDKNGSNGNPWRSSSSGGSGTGGSGSGGSGGGGFGRGSNGGASHDLDDIMEMGRRFFKNGKKKVLALVVAVIFLWMLTGFYRVGADEQGVVLRFGAFVGLTSPGLNYHWPWPMERAFTPKVTIINRVDIGMRSLASSRDTLNAYGGGNVRDVPQESLMLTGDENIVDVDFSVFWVIKDAANFLFNIQNPEMTVKDVAESTMREVVGQNDIQPILTEQRQKTEESVKALMQKTLDSYGAGILITQVKMQKVDPPAAVIDAFRDVQAARADQERARNEAQAYANKVVPEAKGDAARILRAAEAYREQTVAEAEGQAQRFITIYQEYYKAPDVTRERMYLETMEKVLQGANKFILDDSTGKGVVPYLPLNELRPKGEEKTP